MDAMIKNFRGVREAQIQIAPIALICGLNHAGKTSIARAVAAAATGRSLPFEDITKKGSAVMISHGAKEAFVAIREIGKWDASVSWPSAEVTTKGTIPFTSEVAAGLIDLTQMEKKKALEFMITLLKAEPSEKDIAARMEQLGLGHFTEEMLKALKANGWDGTLKVTKEQGSKLKGRWEQVTQTAFGAKKAAAWYPEGWDDSILSLAPEHISAQVEEAAQSMKDCDITLAMADAEKTRLQELADTAPALQDQVVATAEAAVTAQQALTAALKVLVGTPNPSAKANLACPHCEGGISVQPRGDSFEIAKDVPIDAKDLKAMRKAYAEASGAHEKARADYATAKRNHDQVLYAHAQALAAGQKLQEAPTAKGDAKALDIARAHYEKAQRVRMMREQYDLAQGLFRKIEENQAIIAMLGEEGLRREKLMECMTAFLTHFVVPLQLAFGMQEMAIDADLNIHIGKTPFSMLSASEQYRVRVILQIAIARLDGSYLLIIDGADILDTKGRTQLLTILRGLPLHAILCMTLPSPEKAPNLADLKMGVTYWMKDGVCSPVVTQTAQAA